MQFTFKEFIIFEAMYPGNLGVMEMVKFYKIASPEQKIKMKKLIADGKIEEAWQFLQDVTNMKLAA